MGLWIPLGTSNFITMMGFAEPMEPILTKPLPHSTGYSASSLQSIKLAPICQIMTLFSFFLFIQQKRVGWVQESKLMGDSYRGAASLWVCNSVLHLFFQYHSHFTQTNAYWNSQCHSILQSMYTSRLLEKTQIIARPTQLQLLNLQCNVCLVDSIQYWNHQFQT